MVRPDRCRADNDLSPVTNKTCRVQGRTITALSRSLRGRHSTSDIPSTSTPFANGFHYDIGAPAVPIRSHPLPSHLPYTPVLYMYMDLHSHRHNPHPHPHPHYMIPIFKAQKPLNVFSGPGRKLGEDFFDQLVGGVLNSSYNIHDYTSTDYGISSSELSIGRDSGVTASRNKRPDKGRNVLVPTQRKKVKSSEWEQTRTAKGGPIDPELITSYGGHVAGCIWHGQDRGLLKSRLRYMSNLGLAFVGGGINGQELFDVATDPQSRLSSSDKAACYIQYLLGSSLFTDKSGNIVPSKLWPLVKDVRSSGGFA
ncbi:hypothetical protein M9H77_31154 [Catharanthus roseus]|uniref:Uncharacterized protein n=1 Tax=Catharanthus roseus TaxID=4058 RepID=A0ACB9ZZB1_CATRO|nr:hypothetical protein M9H77_31154 [Catharanthus roseus]